MTDGKEGGEYLVGGTKVNANGEPLKTTKDPVVLEPDTEVGSGEKLGTGDAVVAGADKPKAGAKK